MGSNLSRKRQATDQRQRPDLAAKEVEDGKKTEEKEKEEKEKKEKVKEEEKEEKDEEEEDERKDSELSLTAAAVEVWVGQLGDPEIRQYAINKLCRHQSAAGSEMPVRILASDAAFDGLVEEVTRVLPSIQPPANPPGLSLSQAHVVCQALDLLRLMAIHPETQTTFLVKGVVLHVLPFLKSVDKSQPFQNLRRAAMELVEAMAKTEEPEVVLNYLLDARLFRCLFNLMDTACDTCKTSAAFVATRLLTVPRGLDLICGNPMMLTSLMTSLDLMVLKLASVRDPPSDLLENVLMLYVQLSQEPRGKHYLLHKRPLPGDIVNGKIRRFLPAGSLGEQLFCQVIDNLRHSSR